jgi:predicted ATPase
VFQGERELAVPPLDLPTRSSAHATAQSLRDCESVQLFVERAAAVKTAFALSNETAPIIAEICRRLDGLPLAIELAAARLRLLDPDALRSRLDHRLQLLTGGARDLPGRQQTLPSTIAWSYDLLDEDERALFCAMSVFSGGASLDAAASVCLRDCSILDCAESLVSKSLLRSAVEVPGDLRVTMLETTREFGLEQLAWAGELEACRRRHASYFLALAERAEPELWGPDAALWHARLELEQDNLRTVLDWALSASADPDRVLGVRLAAALVRFWWTRSHHTEGLQWLVRALAVASPHSAIRMKALHGAAWLAHMLHESASAQVFLEESLEIAREQAMRGPRAGCCICWEGSPTSPVTPSALRRSRTSRW